MIKQINKRMRITEGLWFNKTNSIITLAKTINTIIRKIDEIVEWINQHEVSDDSEV